MGAWTGFGLGLVCGIVASFGVVVGIGAYQTYKLVREQERVHAALRSTQDLDSFREFMISADAGELELL